GGAEPDYARSDAFGIRRKASEEVEAYVAAGLGAFPLGSQYIKGKLRLARRRRETAVRRAGSFRVRHLREVQVIHRPARGEEVQQHHTGKAHAVFRAAFDFGLI